VLLGILAGIFGTSQRAQLLNLLDGHGWLSNRSAGSVLLANGATGKVDLELDVTGSKGHRLEVLQNANAAELVDQTANTVSTVDLSQFKVSGGQSVATPGAATDVEEGPNAYYVIKKRKGVIQARNLVTGRVIGSISVGGWLTPGVVDSTGRLWSVDTSTGHLLSADVVDGRLERADGARVVPRSTSPYQVELSLADNEPTVLDLRTGRLVEAPDGAISETVALPRSSGLTTASVAIPVNDPELSVPYTVYGAGIGLVNLSSGAVDAPVLVPGVSRFDHLDAPTVFSGRFYVPDLTQKNVLVLQPSDGQLSVAAEPIPDPDSANHVDVTVQGGYLWIDAPTGNDALSVNSQGVMTPVDKTSPPAIRNATSPVSPQNPPPVAQLPLLAPVAPNANARQAAPEKPSAPTVVTAIAGDKDATVNWSGQLDNGSPITTYDVSWTVVGGDSGSPGSQSFVASPGTVGGLKNGTSYLFSVSAANAIGSSPATPASNSVIPSADVPMPPTQVTANSGTDGSITVIWSGADGQGNGISGFNVYIKDTTNPTSSSGSNVLPAPGTSPSSSLTVPSNDLVLGDSYTFTVTTINGKHKESPQSVSSNSALAHAPPFGVAGVTATVPSSNGRGILNVVWQCNPAAATCSGGADVKWFVVTLQQQGATGVAAQVTVAPAAGSSQSHQFTGLMDNTTYVATVVAKNAEGSGPGVQSSPTTTEGFTAIDLYNTYNNPIVGVGSCSGDNAGATSNGSPASTWTQNFVVPPSVQFINAGTFQGSGADSFTVAIQRGGSTITSILVPAGNDWGADPVSFPQVAVTPGETLTIVIQPAVSTNKNFEQSVTQAATSPSASITEPCPWMAGFYAPGNNTYNPGGALRARVGGLGYQ
jgi:hypothetical protein